MSNARYLREALTALGYNLNGSESQIIALEAGPEPRTMVLRDALEAHGVFGSVFCAPATAKNRSLVRLSVNATLTQEQLEKIVSVCGAIREQVQLHLWPSTRRRGDTGLAVRRQRGEHDEHDERAEMAVAA